MKKRNPNLRVLKSQESQCCTSTAEVSKNEDPCCEQPSDGTSCCDKTENREVNSEKTGCC